MIPVYQTKFKGSEAPQEEQGDCFQACVASIFELSLEETFDDKAWPELQWFDRFNDWLKEQWGLGCLYLPAETWDAEVRFAPGSPYLGWHMLEFTSVNLANPEDGHVVVAKDGLVTHNPREGQGIDDVGEYRAAFIFVTLDPSQLAGRALVPKYQP